MWCRGRVFEPPYMAKTLGNQTYNDWNLKQEQSDPVEVYYGNKVHISVFSSWWLGVLCQSNCYVWALRTPKEGNLLIYTAFEMSAWLWCSLDRSGLVGRLCENVWMIDTSTKICDQKWYTSNTNFAIQPQSVLLSAEFQYKYRDDYLI